jgi:hypothetical protein
VANNPIEDSFPWINPQNERCRGPHVPNYCNDLNAMHEAEKTLPSMLEVLQYQQNLSLVTDPNGNPVWFATARQRAEAFLQTIGKWKEAE